MVAGQGKSEGIQVNDVIYCFLFLLLVLSRCEPGDGGGPGEVRGYPG